MRKKIMCVIATCLLSVIVVFGQTQEAFEGTVRTAVSTNLDKLIGNVNNIEVKSGNALADLIAKKSVKKQTKGVNEVLASANGDFEFLTKVKGNKLVQFNTQDGTMLLLDGDKEEVYMTYPFAKAALKYSVSEYKQMSGAMKFEIEVLQDSIRELVGYSCKKAIVSGKMNGQEMNHSEYWYTDEVALPECYLDIFHRPGLVIIENTKVMNTPIYGLVTEIDESPVTDDAFIIPSDYEIFTQKEALAFHKKLNKAAKNKKNYTLGSTIPDVFWDF